MTLGEIRRINFAVIDLPEKYNDSNAHVICHNGFVVVAHQDYPPIVWDGVKWEEAVLKDTAPSSTSPTDR